jgi:hypothetical protein
MPVARAAFFVTRLSPAPVLRIVRFADFTTFVVLDFLRLAILFPPVRYLVGPSPPRSVIVRSNPHHHGFGFGFWNLSRNGTGLVRWLSPVLRVVEMTGSHRHTHTAPTATQRVCAVTCSDCYRAAYPDVVPARHLLLLLSRDLGGFAVKRAGKHVGRPRIANRAPNRGMNGWKSMSPQEPFSRVRIYVTNDEEIGYNEHARPIHRA